MRKCWSVRSLAWAGDIAVQWLEARAEWAGRFGGDRESGLKRQHEAKTFHAACLTARIAVRRFESLGRGEDLVKINPSKVH